MIIERSAFAGMGKFGSRWLGDNFSNWDYMGYSVTGIMMQNILGIPLAGADICGFNDNTEKILCTRWTILGAFYPFSRNHNNLDGDEQAPYIYNSTLYYDHSFSITDIMRHGIRIKYALVRFYYSEISKLSMDGGAFYQPVFFEFPNDINAYVNQTDNIMLGA